MGLAPGAHRAPQALGGAIALAAGRREQAERVCQEAQGLVEKAALVPEAAQAREVADLLQALAEG